MSERAAMAGDSNSPHVIEHKGRVYVIQPVITEGVMLAVETKLYEKAKLGLRGIKSELSEAAYERKLDELRKRFTDGEFSFESKETVQHLKTQTGVIMLLGCMMDCTPAEIMVLIAERGSDVQAILKDVMAISFPKEVIGTARPKRNRKKLRRRH